MQVLHIEALRLRLLLHQPFELRKLLGRQTILDDRVAQRGQLLLPGRRLRIHHDPSRASVWVTHWCTACRIRLRARYTASTDRSTSPAIASIDRPSL